MAVFIEGSGFWDKLKKKQLISKCSLSKLIVAQSINTPPDNRCMRKENHNSRQNYHSTKFWNLFLFFLSKTKNYTREYNYCTNYNCTIIPNDKLRK